MNLEDCKTIYAQIARWALPFLLLLLLFLAFRCNRQEAEGADLRGQLQASLERTRQVENKNGQLVSQNSIVFTRNERDLKALSDSVFNLKDREGKLIAAVSAYTRIIQAANFGHKSAQFDNRPVIVKGDTVKIEQPADPDLVRVPRSFSYADSSLSFEGTVYKNSVDVDSLKIPNTLSLRTVEVKSGFLNLGKTTQVQAINSNPAFRNEKIAQIQIKKRATAWNRWIKPALFAGAGIYIGSQLK